jgi:ribonuclease T2
VIRRILLSCIVPIAAAQMAAAQQVSLEGYFIALEQCPANKKKDSDNPGNVKVEAMRAYSMIARNATPGTHYQITVPGAPVTDARWVPMTCGAYAPKNELVIAGGTGPGPVPGVTPASGLAPDGIEYVLAASWQPAFCASSAGQAKPECVSQTPDRFDATHFSLHGLWPDDLDDKKIFPCYCDRGPPVSCQGSQGKDTSIAISQPVMDELEVVMPGVQSGLHLHEWPKHGSCYEDDKTGPDTGATPDEYFTEVLALMRQLNESPVQALFADHLGEVLSREKIEGAFDQAFGAGAGKRVIIRCNGSGGSKVISELWIGLKGDITPTSNLASLIVAAPPSSTASNEESCASGRVLEVSAN